MTINLTTSETSFFGFKNMNDNVGYSYWGIGNDNIVNSTA